MKVTIIYHLSVFYLYVVTEKQVDTLISKTQPLQILYLDILCIKLHILSWIKPDEIHENLIPHRTIPYSVNYYITIKTQTYLITGQQVPSQIVNTYLHTH